MKTDIRTSHILVKMDADPAPEDTIEAYTKAIIIRDFINGKPNPAALKKYEAMVNAGLKISKTSPPKDTLAAFNKLNPLKKMMKLKTHDFASVAKVVSDHTFSKPMGGDVGYLTGLSGQSYPYEYENAAYKATQGQMYGPVRSPMGYHLLLVTDKRPHVELHLAHIMLLFKKGMTHDDSVKIKTKIDSISGALKQGASFEELAKKVSEHRESAKRGGDIGWLAISSNYPAEFKEAAFAIKGDRQYSAPVQSKFGWHVIKRIASRDLPAFDTLKADLKSKIQQDARNMVAKDMMIAKIRSEYQFKEVSKCSADFYAVVDSTLPMGGWKADKAKNLNKPMFTLLDKTFSQQDFAAFMEKNYRLVGKMSSKRMVDALYKKFIDESCINTKESRLEEEFPDFKMLMEEYRDGILLFNLTDQKVWTKAIKDTTGAKEYYAKNKEHFLWEDRLDASIYSCKDEKTAEKIKKLLKQNKTDKEILAAVNKDTVINVMIESKLYMKGDNAMLDANGWNPGISANQPIKGKVVFMNVRKVEKATPKTYTEARGLVTSEYQSWLEKEWISSLKKKYPVSIDRKVFDSIQ
jgi:peptidyl-prolyl cis-trans isomerase SurA